MRILLSFLIFRAAFYIFLLIWHYKLLEIKSTAFWWHMLLPRWLPGTQLKLGIQLHRLLIHCGWVTQICAYTLQLCKTDDANLRFLTRAWFPYTIHLIKQYMEPVSEWSC